MSTYVWCEDSGSGYAFWNTVFKIMYPEFIVETKNSNTRLNKAIMYMPSPQSHLHGLESHPCRILRATLPESRAAREKVI